MYAYKCVDVSIVDFRARISFEYNRSYASPLRTRYVIAAFAKLPMPRRGLEIDTKDFGTETSVFVDAEQGSKRKHSESCAFAQRMTNPEAIAKARQSAQSSGCLSVCLSAEI